MGVHGGLNEANATDRGLETVEYGGALGGLLGFFHDLIHVHIAGSPAAAAAGVATVGGAGIGEAGFALGDADGGAGVPYPFDRCGAAAAAHLGRALAPGETLETAATGGALVLVHRHGDRIPFGAPLTRCPEADSRAAEVDTRAIDWRGTPLGCAERPAYARPACSLRRSHPGTPSRPGPR